MNHHKTAIQFTDAEKQALMLRLTNAAETRAVKRPVRFRLKPCVAGLAAVLMLAGAGAAGLSGTPLFDKVKAQLFFDGQELPLEARMKLNPDGTAVIEVDGNTETTTITVPEATVKAMLDGTSDIGFSVSRQQEEAYSIEEQDGRVWLFVNERIPLDITDLLADGYTFSYFDKAGEKQTATVSGTVGNVQIKEAE